MSNERSASKNFPAAFSLEGQRVLLTGASGGLGQGIAACLVAAGAHVILSGTSTEKLEQLSKKLGPQTGVAAFDITRTDEAEAFAQAVEAEYSSISALINNAGITVKKPVAEMEQASFESVLTTHVSGAFALTRAFLPQIVSRIAECVGLRRCKIGTSRAGSDAFRRTRADRRADQRRCPGLVRHADV